MYTEGLRPSSCRLALLHQPCILILRFILNFNERILKVLIQQVINYIYLKDKHKNKYMYIDS